MVKRSDIKSLKTAGYKLFKEQLDILKEERKLHLEGKSKSYTQTEALEIMLGKREL